MADKKMVTIDGNTAAAHIAYAHPQAARTSGARR